MSDQRRYLTDEEFAAEVGFGEGVHIPSPLTDAELRTLGLPPADADWKSAWESVERRRRGSRRRAAQVRLGSDALRTHPQRQAKARERTGTLVQVPEPVAKSSRRLWAAVVLARSVLTLEAILQGLPVHAGGLDAVVFHHALRGGPLPSADSYVTVTDAMLDAIAEAEPALVVRYRKAART